MDCTPSTSPGSAPAEANFQLIGLFCTVLLLIPIMLEAQSIKSGSRPSAFGERTGQRAAMVINQLQARGIRNPQVLRAMRSVPRHAFIPPGGQELAYRDHPVGIGHNQTISQPYIVAFMTEALQIKPGARVLEIGTGSGYQAAVLAELGAAVYTIEIVSELGKQARTALEALEYKTIQFRIGDGYQGWPKAAPFDAIIVTAAPDHVPPKLVEQLKVGGRMIIPVGRSQQELLLIERKPGGVIQKKVMHVRFVPMTGEAQKK